MFDVIMYAVNAVFPIMLLIFLGYSLKKHKFFDDSFLNQGNKLLFHVILPVLVLFNIYNIPDIASINIKLVGFAVCAVLTIFLIGLAVVLIFVKDKGSRGVILQCTFRSNFAIIGIPLSEALGGTTGSSVTSVLLAFVIPVFNVLAVISLSVFTNDGKGKKSVGQILLGIIKNPLIVASLIGLGILIIRSFIPVDTNGELVFSIKNDLKFLYDSFDIIGKATNALALIILGGQLDFSNLKGKVSLISLGTFMRVIIAPLIGLSAAVICSHIGIINCGSAEYSALIALFGAPVAVASAIMAAEMDADADLARQLVVWTSLCPIATIFLIAVIFRSFGLL